MNGICRVKYGVVGKTQGDGKIFIILSQLLSHSEVGEETYVVNVPKILYYACYKISGL